MKVTSLPPNARIDVIDALRGSALCGILLLHSIEHWDFLRGPDHLPAWLQRLDQPTHDLAFFLFGGKAYAVFALMFGVSFFLILDRWTQQGIPFAGKFLWRLMILGVIGYLHGLIYCGDILLIIALLGLPLIFLHRLSNRVLVALSVVLVLQIPSLWETGRVVFDPGYRPAPPWHWAVYGQLFETFTHGSFRDVVTTNLWQGQTSRLLWTYETGRYLQMLGLFVWGLLLARARVFAEPVRCARVARRALTVGLIAFAILYPIKLHLHAWGLQGLRHYVADNLVSSYVNLAQMAIWAGGLVLLYHWTRARTLLRGLAPYGRMSLTGYVTQGLVGVPLFYGFGLGWYRYGGAFASVLIGAALGVGQCVIAYLWLRRFHYGPLEWLWRSCTFRSFATPFVRRPRTCGAVAAPVAAVP